MRIYLHGSAGKTPVENHTVVVCPAGHLPKDCPEADWYDDTGEKRKPREWLVEFKYGQAEVPDPVGKYMLAAGLAEKSRLVIPNSWGP